MSLQRTSAGPLLCLRNGRYLCNGPAPVHCCASATDCVPATDQRRSIAVPPQRTVSLQWTSAGPLPCLCKGPAPVHCFPSAGRCLCSGPAPGCVLATDQRRSIALLRSRDTSLGRRAESGELPGCSPSATDHASRRTGGPCADPGHRVVIAALATAVTSPPRTAPRGPAPGGRAAPCVGTRRDEGGPHPSCRGG